MDATGLPRILTALLLGLALAQPALAQQEAAPAAPQKPALAPSSAAQSLDAMRERYPKGAIGSDEVAEQAQVDVQSARTLLEAEFAAAEYACYDRFFTNSCIDKAREARRAGLAVLRPIELEANAFQRQARVDKREREMEERRVKAEAETQERTRLQQENQQKAAQRSEERARREQERQTEQAAREGIVDDRVQRHDERLQRLRRRGSRQGARTRPQCRRVRGKAEASRRAAKESGGAPGAEAGGAGGQGRRRTRSGEVIQTARFILPML